MLYVAPRPFGVSGFSLPPACNADLPRSMLAAQPLGIRGWEPHACEELVLTVTRGTPALTSLPVIRHLRGAFFGAALMPWYSYAWAGFPQ